MLMLLLLLSVAVVLLLVALNFHLRQLLQVMGMALLHVVPLRLRKSIGHLAEDASFAE